MAFHMGSSLNLKLILHFRTRLFIHKINTLMLGCKSDGFEANTFSESWVEKKNKLLFLLFVKVLLLGCMIDTEQVINIKGGLVVRIFYLVHHIPNVCIFVPMKLFGENAT